MKRTWTIIGVSNVSRSFRWYQSLLGLPETLPAHDDFGQLVDEDGTVLLCLHQWGAHDHPPLSSPDRAQPGNGLLLFFRVDDFDRALLRARALVDRLEEEPHLNPGPGTMEFSLRDPDGYYVSVSALSATEAGVTANDLQAFADAWNRHDIEALMSFMAGDCVFEASSGHDAWGTRYVGRDAVREGFASVWQVFPDARWENARHFVHGDRGVSEWTFTGTRSDGVRVEVRGGDLFTFRDGKIVLKNSYRKNRSPAARA